jgi:hypothetical protein
LRSRNINFETFAPWFRKYDPDIVIGHFPDAMDWMSACGAKLPGTHGFVCLNRLRTSGNCACLDLQTAQLGARSTELVVGQLLHNELGVPTQPSLTTIPARLIEGPTLRSRGVKPARSDIKSGRLKAVPVSKSSIAVEDKV